MVSLPQVQRQFDYKGFSMKMISTTLKLAFCPLSAREMTMAYDDADIAKALEHAHIYMIAKKTQIYFSNVRSEGNHLKLKIQDKDKFVDVSLPLDQSIFVTDPNNDLILDIGSNDKNVVVENDVVSVAHGLKFYQLDRNIANHIDKSSLKSYMTPENFVVWLSPEKLLYHYRNKQLRIPNFDKSKDSFWNYEILYIGKATEESVLKRLDGHKTFLKILQSEVEEYKQIRDDIVLLFFEVNESTQGLLVEKNTSEKEFIDAVTNENLPSIETLCLEAEKIYVNKFTPKYNEIIFKSYPQSADGLCRYDYDIIDYTLSDGINLLFKNMTFVGGDRGNHLVYMKGEGVHVETSAGLHQILANKMIDAMEYSSNQDTL